MYQLKQKHWSQRVPEVKASKDGCLIPGGHEWTTHDDVMLPIIARRAEVVVEEMYSVAVWKRWEKVFTPLPSVSKRVVKSSRGGLWSIYRAFRPPGQVAVCHIAHVFSGHAHNRISQRPARHHYQWIIFSWCRELECRNTGLKTYACLHERFLDHQGECFDPSLELF